MNDRIPIVPPRRETSNEPGLEQQMADCGLSNDTRRFLRNLHVAEKQLNDAFSKAHQGGRLEACVSEVYREMYGTEQGHAPRSRGR
ncbi:hypothetical protein ACPPVV_01645 [Rhodanobacter sp. Col0626]|uniref:hypothetical protein n=1 Tax=Rhodanobacter sp. Col0626 TaxID=3415679 RepID=UPI003CEACB03